MADGVYLPPSKPTARPGGPPAFPPTKAQATGATRLAYRPYPAKSTPRRRRRGFCCSCCLCFVMLLAVLVILAALAGGIFYAIYRPRRPVFSVSALRVVSFNVSSSGHLTSHLDLNVTSRNPNKKLAYLYDPITFSILSSGANLGDGSFHAFVQDAGSVTPLSSQASISGQELDAATASGLRRNRGGRVPVEVEMETKAGVKIGGLKTKRMGMKVRCEGLSVTLPAGGKKAAAASPGGDCTVKLRLKIWKWSIQ